MLDDGTIFNNDQCPQPTQANGASPCLNSKTRCLKVVDTFHAPRVHECRQTTLYRDALLYNQQLPQSALRSSTPLQAMKDWHNLKPELFKIQPYHLP